MDKKIGIIALITIFLLIAGQACPRKAREEVVESKYRVGNQGLVLSFMNNMPPNKIYDLDELRVGIEIKNKGAYPSSTENKNFIGKLYLRGFDPNYIIFDEGDWQEIDRNLFGKDQYNPEGGYSVVDFTSSIIQLPEGVESYKPALLATACYEYQTIATPVVCIDPNPYSAEVREKVCTVHDVSLTSQGGPVAVTRVEEAVMKDKIQFKIYVQNVGDGLVVDVDQLDACPGRLDYTNLNRVDFSAEISGEPLYDCRPNDYQIDLYNNRGFIICYASKPTTGDAYETPLKIQLDYGYMSSISKQIEIIKTPE